MQEYKGMNYIKPSVFILSDNGIGQSEFAARTCYNSYNQSENIAIERVKNKVNDYVSDCNIKEELYDIENSELLKQLSFVHFHHSVLEHSYITFYIKNISRGVLQELVRHRIASYSVKSTRYTLDNLMYNFILAMVHKRDIAKEYFIENSLMLDLFVTTDEKYNKLELASIFKKLKYHYDNYDKRDFIELIIPKSNVDKFIFADNDEKALEIINLKKKRNVGDAFKHIITDNFKTELTMTINLRSLKNFFDLRLNGAAWFQIQWLAQEMKNVLPKKYKSLIFKEEK